MIIKLQNGKEVEIESVSGRYEDDIQIDSASYVDNDEEVTDEDIDEVYNNHPDSLYEMWLDKQMDAADYYYGD